MFSLGNEIIRLNSMLKLIKIGNNPKSQFNTELGTKFILIIMKKIFFLFMIGFLNNPIYSQCGCNCLSGNCQDGYGKAIDSDGNTYVGNFVNNSYEGNGKFITAKGNKFEGNWVKGSPNGYGVLSTNAGKLVGNWSGLEYLDGYMISTSGNIVSQGIYIDQKLTYNSNTNIKKDIGKVSYSGNKKIPITRKCVCCGIAFTIKYGWGYSNSISQSIYQFGSSEEQATEYLTKKIAQSLGMAYDSYHPTIKYHSRKCAYDCGN